MGPCDLWHVRGSQHRERMAPSDPWAPRDWGLSEALSARAFGLFERPQRWPLRVLPLRAISANSARGQTSALQTRPSQ